MAVMDNGTFDTTWIFWLIHYSNTESFFKTVYSIWHQQEFQKAWQSEVQGLTWASQPKIG